MIKTNQKHTMENLRSVLPPTPDPEKQWRWRPTSHYNLLQKLLGNARDMEIKLSNMSIHVNATGRNMVASFDGEYQDGQDWAPCLGIDNNLSQRSALKLFGGLRNHNPDSAWAMVEIPLGKRTAGLELDQVLIDGLSTWAAWTAGLPALVQALREEAHFNGETVMELVKQARKKKLIPKTSDWSKLMISPPSAWEILVHFGQVNQKTSPVKQMERGLVFCQLLSQMKVF